MTRAVRACGLMFILLVALLVVMYAGWRLGRPVDPSTVCLSHPATIEHCCPVYRAAVRDRHLGMLCRGARRRVMLFCSYTDLAGAERLARIADDMSVECAVFYEPRPHHADRHAVAARMATLPSHVRTAPVRRRTITMDRFPYLNSATSHYKIAAADDLHFICGSGNALRECYYMDDKPMATCEAARKTFMAPAFLEFDVALTFSRPVPQICDYLALIARQEPWAERSMHVTFADRCEFHIFPAGVLSRSNFLAQLIGTADRRVLIAAMSVWPTGAFRAAVEAAVSRGCEVTLIGPAYECSRSQQLFARLNRAAAYRSGWKYREWGRDDGLVHAKFLVVDDDVALPSFNFSYKSVDAAVEDETALVLRGRASDLSRDALMELIDSRSKPLDPPDDPVGRGMLEAMHALL